jgi:putative peptidoglycan lipid II flippase
MTPEESTVPSSSSTNHQIARAAGTVMVAYILSNLVGLASQIVINHGYGTGDEIEAFNAANRITDLLFQLMAGGALASAFIPTFTGLITGRDRDGAWRLASAIANLLIIILSVVGILVDLCAPWVVRTLLVPGFSASKQALVVSLLRVMMPSVVVFGLSGLSMGILNSHQKFFIPALTPSMYNIGKILGVLLLGPKYGIYGLAIGVIAGSVLHLALQIPSLLKLKGNFSFTLGRGFAPVKEVIVLMGPRVFGVAIVQLNFLVNNLLASFLPTGSQAAITVAFTLMLMPEAAIAQSIATAALPAFSAQVAKGKPEEMRNSLAASLRSVLLLAVPAEVGLILLRVPIITLLYQHGAFDEHSTQLVAWALLWYSLGLVSHSVVEIVSRAFYALHDTKTPVLVGAAAMTINIILSILLAGVYFKQQFYPGWFAHIGWSPHGGLALSNTIATTLEMTALLFIMRRRLNGLHGASVLKGFGVALAAAAAMGIVLFIWMMVFSGRSAWIVGLGGVFTGCVVYAVLIAWMRVPELQNLLAAIKRRLAAG